MPRWKTRRKWPKISLSPILLCSEFDNRRNRAIERADLLILDDFGMQAFDSQSRGILMDIIEDRNQKRSTTLKNGATAEEANEV